jgi:hypothetical protein
LAISPDETTERGAEAEKHERPIFQSKSYQCLVWKLSQLVKVSDNGQRKWPWGTLPLLDFLLVHQVDTINTSKKTVAILTENSTEQGSGINSSLVILNHTNNTFLQKLVTALTVTNSNTTLKRLGTLTTDYTIL